MDSIRDRFNRLQTPSRLAPSAGITATNQYGQRSFGGNRRNPPMMMRPTAPTLSPMMREVLRQAQMKKTQAASGTGIPGTTPPATTTPPPSQPSGFMGAFSQPLTSPVGQAISQAAIAGARASDYSPTPVSLGRVLAEMGAAASKGYSGAQQQELANLLTQAKIAEKVGKSGQAFSGQSMEAQSFNALLNIGPKIKAGTATEPEKATYSLAHGRLAKPQPIPTYDELGNQTITVVPAQDLSMFPDPPGGAGRIGTTTTKPSSEAIKSGKFIKSMDSMALNVNSYRQALANLNRADMVSGAAEFPTDAMSEAAAIAEGLRLNLKELYELGALVGGDFQILDNLLTSPNSVKAAKMGGPALAIQLDQLERILAQKLAEKDATLSGTYSTPIVTRTKEDWDKVKPGQYAKLPNGTIKLKAQP
jgi:hypothetical protein